MHRFAFCCVLFASAQAAFAQAGEREHLRDNVLAQLAWKELGPVQSGGRVVDLAVHPQRSQTFWAAAASGGIWRTDNGGVTFRPQFQRQHSISIGDVCVAPSNGDVLYVGTGEANNQRSSYWGNGVYRSDDGGETWTHKGLERSEHIGRIVVHPDDPDTAYVAALGALYTSNAERGLYKTTDGGATWAHVLDLGADVGVVDVLLHPQQPDVVFACSYERRRRAWDFDEGGQGSRLWRSQDAGATWKQLGGGLPEGELGRIGVDAFAGDGDTLYAVIENLNPAPPKAKAEQGDGDDDDDGKVAEAPAEVLADPVARQQWLAGPEEEQDGDRRPRRRLVGGEVYRSDDGGETWSKTHDDERSIAGSPAYYYGQVRVDPSDRDTVYVLSVPVYASTDGGRTWTPKGRSRDGVFADRLHVDHHALWIDPDDGAHCLLGNDGGLAVTWDRGANWDHLTHLPILQFYAIAADDRSPYRVYGGLQDNGTWGFPIHGETSAGIEALDAYKVTGGDGFQIQIDPSDPDVVYTESQFGGLVRSDLQSGERKGIKPEAVKGQQPLRFNWNTPILISPHAPHTLYTGSQFLHRSFDRGDTWTAISEDLTRNDADRQKGDVPHCTITTISESPLAAGLLWIGTDDGKVWRTRDGGGRYYDLSDRFPAEVRALWVSRVEASPHHADTAFVSFTGYREDLRAPFVFRTDDGGETFLPIAHDLPQEPVNVIRQHPRRANVLLCGTEMGCYVSIDDGAHWHPLGQGLPRVAVHDLLVHQRHHHVLVGTHGRGIFALDAALLEALEPAALRRELLALPPSDGTLLRGRIDRGYTGARQWRADNPFTTPTFRYVLAHDRDDDVLLEVLDATGAVLWTQQGDKTAGYHEVPWRSERRRGRGRQDDGPRPGSFVIRVTAGGTSDARTFTVHDRRGRESLLGAWPGELFEALDGDEEGEGDGGDAR